MVFTDHKEDISTFALNGTSNPSPVRDIHAPEYPMPKSGAFRHCSCLVFEWTSRFVSRGRDTFSTADYTQRSFIAPALRNSLPSLTAPLDPISDTALLQLSRL